jgi:hypothetical protein
MLSQNNDKGPLTVIPISCIRFLATKVHTPCAIAQYFASTHNRATTSCFLLLHKTRLLPIKEQYPNMDLLSPDDLAQSTSVKASTFKCYRRITTFIKSKL